MSECHDAIVTVADIAGDHAGGIMRGVDDRLAACPAALPAIAREAVS